MEEEIFPDKAPPENPGLSGAIFVVWFLAVNCIWILMAINGYPNYLCLLMFLVTALLGALYLVWRKHLAVALILTAAAAFAGYAVMGFYSRGHGPKNGTMSALRAITSIESAVMNFNSEYGVLPRTPERISLNGPEGVELLTVLLGNEKNTADMQNSRGIRFLSIKETKNRRNGLQYSDKGDKIEGVFDSWGNPYVVVMDTKNEGRVHFNLGSRIVDLPGRSVAVYSAGADGKAGTRDDIKTWGD